MNELLVGLLICTPVAFFGLIFVGRRLRANVIQQRYTPEDGRRILRSEIWLGETKAQVADTFGPPSSVDEKISRKRALEIWRYGPMVKKRSQLSITFEDGVVVAWERRPEIK